MRLTTTLAALTLAAAGLIATAGTATAQDASWNSAQLYADDNSAGLAGAQGSVSPTGAQHADFYVYADGSGVSSGFNNANVSWGNE